MIVPSVPAVTKPSITQTDRKSADVTGTSHDFTSVSIGAADNNRVVIVPVLFTHATITLSSATIGGETATITGGATLNSEVYVCLLTALVPSGITATVSLTFSSALSSDGVAISAYRMVEQNFILPSDSDSAYADSTSVSLNLAAPVGSAVVAAYLGEDSNKAVTWVGATEDFDLDGSLSGGWRHSGAHDNELAADATHTVSASGDTQKRFLIAGLWK